MPLEEACEPSRRDPLADESWWLRRSSPAATRSLVAIAAVLVLSAGSAGAQPPTAVTTPATVQLAAWLAGEYSNEAQAPLLGVAPGGGKRQAQDRLHVHVRRVEVPALKGTSLYVQWNRDRADGPIARQRIWTLIPTPEGAALSVSSLVDAEAFTDALANPRALEVVGPEDLSTLPPGCEVTLVRAGEGWLGTTAPKCAVTERSGRRLSLQIRIQIPSAGGFFYQEKWFADPDFTPVSSLPKTGSYDFRRVR